MLEAAIDGSDNTRIVGADSQAANFAEEGSVALVSGKGLRKLPLVDRTRVKPRATIERAKQEQSRHRAIALTAGFTVSIRMRIPAYLKGVQGGLGLEQRLCLFNAAESAPVVDDLRQAAREERISQGM